MRQNPVRWEEAEKQLQVSSLARGADGKYIATLRGIGVVEAGSTVSIQFMGLTYRWKIGSITSSGIVPERIGAYPQR
jgi:hypothetical protein